jgi:TonB family protein
LSRTGNEASANSPGGQDAGRRLIAVTRDAALARALQETQGEITVVIVPDLRQFSDEMMRHASNLALLDSAVVDDALPRLVDALTRQFPDLRLMVAGQSSEQAELASRIASERVFRFVHKPASTQRLKLFLEAAAREPGRRARSPAMEGAPPRPPSRLAFVIAGLVAACIAVAAAWLFWPEGAAARLNARDLAKVEQMMQQAEAASSAKRFVSFDGSSSAELYRDVLKLDAVNEQARAGLDNALHDAISDARKTLAAGQLDTATNTMEAVRLIDPDHPGLQQLVAEVQAETTRALEDATARELMAERQRQIQVALGEMSERIRAGALLDPDADNAITHFQAAQSLSAGDPAVRSARNELTAALVTAGEQALQDKHLQDARSYAAATSRINSSATSLAALYWHLEEAETAAATPQPKPRPLPSASEMARTLEAVVQVAPVAAPEPKPPAPEATPEPAEPAWVPGEGVISTSQLKTLHRGEAEFPNEARVGQISGWVELEFTIARNGSVKDIEVTASEPRRTFDSAAMKAMRGYRYEPVTRDGQPVEQRARMRMRFTFQNQ